MKGKQPFRDDSPRKNKANQPKSPTHSRNDLQEQQSHSSQDLQFKITTLLEEASNREQKYHDFIELQQKNMELQTQNYLQELKSIKDLFTQFIQKQPSSNKSVAFKEYQEYFSKDGGVQGQYRKNSKQFTLSLKQKVKESESSTTMEPFLDCFIHFYYYTPFVDDYIRYQMPRELRIQLRVGSPAQILKSHLLIVQEEDQEGNLHCLMNRIPFRIVNEHNHDISLPFQIKCELEDMVQYEKKEVQIQISDENGYFTVCYGKCFLGSLLYFEDDSSSWQLKPVSLYSPLNGKKVSEISIKIGNRLDYREISKHQKIQSENPMELAIKHNTHQDAEERMIQRISKFKNQNNSLLLGAEIQTKSSNLQRAFENDNNKILMEHKKKKELNEIIQFKSNHKEQLISKKLNEAVEKYATLDVEIGKPKYLIVQYCHSSGNHSKIQVEAHCSSSKNIEAKDLENLVEIKFLSMPLIGKLLKMGLLAIPPECYYDYQYSEQDQSIWALAGMTLALVVKIICIFPKNLQIISTNKSALDLKINIKSEFGEQLQNFAWKIKIKEPCVDHHLYVHNYAGLISQMSIPLQNISSEMLQKCIISNIPHLQFHWNSQFTTLSLKIPHSAAPLQSCYLIVNEKYHSHQIATFRINIHSYPQLKLSHYSYGQLRKYQLTFLLDQKTIQHLWSNSSSQKDSLKVKLITSKPEACWATFHNQMEFTASVGKSYDFEVKIQSFEDTEQSQKLIVLAVDNQNKFILGQWLFLLESSNSLQHKSVYQISLNLGEPLKYKFDLINQNNQPKEYRLFSSNLSILTVPVNLIPLFANQITTVDCEFLIERSLTEEERAKGLFVILVVTEGSSSYTSLFQIKVYED